MPLSFGRKSVLLLALVTLSACAPESTPDAAAQETIAALSTRVAMVAPTATATMPSATPLPSVTPTIPPTETPRPTDTVEYPDGKTYTPTRTLTSRCNAAFFVGFVGPIQSGAFVSPLAPFSVIWDVRNFGTCTWDPDYQVVLVSGERMGAQNRRLGKTIEPNDHIFITIPMVAPDQAGGYRAQWMLVTSDGLKFGVGPDGRSTLPVYIHVGP